MLRFDCPGIGKLVAAKRLADVRKAPPTLRTLRARIRDAKRARSYGDTIAAYAEAAKLYGDDADLLNEYAWFLVTAKETGIRDPARAVELARRAVDLSGGKDGSILDTLAEALYQTGELEEAAGRAARAAELSPHHDEIVGRAKRFADELRRKRGEE